MDECGEPSAFSTSVITRYPLDLSGSGNIDTGFSRQSELFPSACCVELPSKDHIGQSSIFPEKSLSILVLLLRDWVGLKPSNQIYSNLDFCDMIKFNN